MKKKTLPKDIKGYLESELRAYPKTKQELEALKMDIILESPLFEPGAGVRTSGLSKPVERSVLALEKNKRISYLDRLIRAIETVLAAIPPEKYKLVELKYWQTPRCLTDEGIARIIACSRPTVWRWSQEIVTAIAVEMGMQNL